MNSILWTPKTNGPLCRPPSPSRVRLHSIRRSRINSSNFFKKSSPLPVEIYSEPPDPMQTSFSRPITSSDLGLDPSEKENEIRCPRCQSKKPLQDFAKGKSRGSNRLNNIDTDRSESFKECSKCRAKRRLSQGKANGLRSKANEEAKRKSLKCSTWEETLSMIDAGFAPTIDQY
jgi:hypothetical protein